MQSKHEAPAVSVAASLITMAIAVLQFSGESIGIGIRTACERALQSLGPDHRVDVVDPKALRAMLVAAGGEEFAVDVFDNNAPVPRSKAEDSDERLAALERSMSQLADENARLRAEADAAKKPAEPAAKPAETKTKTT